MKSAHLLEVVQVPLVVLARPVSGEVCRLLVLDDFSADVKLLQRLLVAAGCKFAVAHMPCARPARRSLGEPCCGVVLQTSAVLDFLLSVKKLHRHPTAPSADARANEVQQIVHDEPREKTTATPSISTPHAH